MLEKAGPVRCPDRVEIEAVDDTPSGQGQFAVVPNGKRLVSVKQFIDEYRTAPQRRVGTSEHQTAESFMRHVQEFKTANTRVFAFSDASGLAQFVAVYDYHPTGDDITKAGFGQHRAVYRPELSNEWDAWSTRQMLDFTQLQFARWIEDHIEDITAAPTEGAPLEFAKLVGGRYASPSDLIALSRGLSLTVKTNVQNAVTTAQGIINVVFENAHTDAAGAPINVPNLFLLFIPVFREGDLYRVPCRLRYEVDGSRLMWSYHMYRADRVYDHAVQGIADKVELETRVPVFRGTAEGSGHTTIPVERGGEVPRAKVNELLKPTHQGLVGGVAR